MPINEGEERIELEEGGKLCRRKRMHSRSIRNVWKGRVKKISTRKELTE